MALLNFIRPILFDLFYSHFEVFLLNSLWKKMFPMNINIIFLLFRYLWNNNISPFFKTTLLLTCKIINNAMVSGFFHVIYIIKAFSWQRLIIIYFKRGFFATECTVANWNNLFLDTSWPHLGDHSLLLFSQYL